MARKPAQGHVPAQQEIPVQPVAKPILCKPFAEPTRHWVYDTRTDDARAEVGRRPAPYWFKTQPNALRWRYVLALPVDGRIWHVDFDDWMFLIDDKVMMNRATMRKWGVDLGAVTLTFIKR